MVNSWKLWHHKDGAYVELVERPLWAEIAGDAYDLLTRVTGHVLCCDAPEIFWKIPLGLPSYYEDDPEMLDNSLAGWLHSKSGDFEFWIDRKDTGLKKIPVSDDIAKELNSDLAFLYEKEDNG